GVCMTPVPVAVGDACDVGPIVPGRIASRDRITAPVRRRCQSGVCDPRKLGLPGGECVASCIDGTKPRGPDQTCGRIGATGFNLCLLTAPFPTCLRDQTRPISVRACDRDAPCRD